MTTYLRKTNFVEGVGDELIYAISAFLGILISMIIFLLRARQQAQEIHPDSAENVRSTRERIHEQNPGTESSNENSQPRHENHGQLDCPVCLGSLEYGVDTNCGHIFCGNCIITYWEHGTWLGAVRCPVCRTQVSLLLVNFTAEENQRDSPERTHILEKIYDYNRRFSGAPRSIMDHLRDLPTLLRHAFSEFFSVGGLIWMFRLRIIVCFLAAFLYFISPLDIIPEAAFGIFGFLDDLFIILLLAIYISIIYRQIVQNRAAHQAANAAHQATEPLTPTAPPQPADVQ